jgi:diacylglycerol kinase (ATP)
MKNEKFNLFKNLRNSLNGLREVTRNETPMQIEVILLVVLGGVLLFLEMPVIYKLILFISLFLPILAELLNSAVERCVDLVTEEFHTLAKHAKDAGSAAVLVALIITGLIWLSVFFHVYYP